MEIYLNMYNGSVLVNFTIGFGNNIFQYCFARLLAEKNNFNLIHSEISQLSIQDKRKDHFDKSLPTYLITDTNAFQAMEQKLPRGNYIVQGYYEDYRFYKDHISRIRSWFPQFQIKNKKDLILHLRLQNRLIQKFHHMNHVQVDCYKRIIEKFDCENLHIITDAKKWDLYDKADIQEIRDEVASGPNPKAPWVSEEKSIEYMNHLVSGLEEYRPIIHCNNAPVIPNSGALRGSFMDDFELISSFNNVMLSNSTFSWWAALLGGASKVGTFGPWKPNKGLNSKNLGRTTFPGWFSWGTIDDLYWKNL